MERVTEWQARKETHSLDPMVAQQRILSLGGGRQLKQQQATDPDPSGSVVVAKLGRVTLARSARVQHANKRAYFPVEDCVSARFLPSPKRWR